MYTPRSGAAGPCGGSVFSFLRTTSFLQWLHHFKVPAAMHKALNVFTSLPTLLTFWVFFFFYYSHPSEYEVVSPCGFYVHLPLMTIDVEHLFFCMFVASCISSLEKCLFKFFAIFNWVVCLLVVVNC